MFLLVFVWTLLAWFDAWFTPRQLNRTGVQAEMMPIQRYLFSKHKTLGQVSIVIPSVVIAIVAWRFHLQTTLALVVGMRIFLAIKQWEQMKKW